MTQRLKNIGHNAPLLPRSDLRDWMAEDDLAHLVVQAVQQLPLSAFAAHSKGCGDEQYPLRMMSALLIYGYINGIFQLPAHQGEPPVEVSRCVA